MQNPFTTTYSKIPDYTYIPTEQTREIIENFSYDRPSESVYKITGVRGSGKTVLLAKIEEEFQSEYRKKEGWLVYRLSPTRDMLRQLASAICKENIIKEKYKEKSFNISANVMGTGIGVGMAHTGQDELFDVGIELEEMIIELAKCGKKIMIGVDEVSKTQHMIEFASESGKWTRAGYPVYLVCTGLYDNIEQLYNVNNLTFFRRATTVKTDPLNLIRISDIYKNKLGVDKEKAREMAKLTNGYPYAYQELGGLYFKKNKNDTLEDIKESLKAELYAYAYEKIWEEMSAEDRALVRLLTEKKEYSREEILKKMEKPGNYSVYRDRLDKRGIISSRRGYISLALPFFNEYIKDYCMEG